MRIGADGCYLRWPRTGLGRYLDGILHGIERALPPQDDLHVYYNSLPGPRLFTPPTRERFVRLPKATAWNQVGVPLALRLDRCDVYLGGANIIPAAGGPPAVLVLHDCIAFRAPEAKPATVGRYLRRWMRHSARRARRIVAVSRWAAEDAGRYLGVDPGGIAVVHPGVDGRFRPPGPGEREAERADLHRRLGVASPFVLQVGAFERHKGASTAARAVDRLRRRGFDVSLVRCGPGRGPGAAGATVDLGYVDDDLLLQLYRAAAAVCVASSHEGFGLPLVEAMACATPVVAARVSALPETGGDAVLYADPGDDAAFAAALERILSDAAEAERLRALGLARAARLSWDAAAARILDVVHEAAA